MSRIMIRFPAGRPRPSHVTISQLMAGRPGSTVGVWRGIRRRVFPHTKAVRYNLRRHRGVFPYDSDADFAIRVTAKFPGRGWRFFDINGQSTKRVEAPQLLVHGNYTVILQPPAPQIVGAQYGAVPGELESVGDPEAAAAAADDTVEADTEMTPMAWAKLAGAAVVGFVLGRKF
jgi:hypothetical protein